MVKRKRKIFKEEEKVGLRQIEEKSKGQKRENPAIEVIVKKKD